MTEQKRQKPERTPKWLRIVGWVIFGVLVLCMINSTYYFLVQAKFPFIGWIFFNACFVASLIWLVGFVFHWRWLTMASLPFLLFFGGGGLVFFPWSGYMITAQISHIFMMLAFAHTLVDAFLTRGWKSKVIGLAAGIAAFAGFLILQQNYTKAHPELWERMMGPESEWSTQVNSNLNRGGEMTKTNKIDYKKMFKELYLPPAKEPVIVDVPPMNFIMIDGVINPGETPETSKDFQEALPVLYGLSYTLKFMLKKAHDPKEYVIMPLEGLWWTDEEGGFDMKNTKAPWHWTVMIMQPDFITREHYLEAVAQLKGKKAPPSLSKARFERFHESRCVQIMHVGPFSEEGPTIERLHQFAFDQGYKLRGKHHEIYLSDPRRTAPERLKTVLRQPVE